MKRAPESNGTEGPLRDSLATALPDRQDATAAGRSAVAAGSDA